MGLVLATSAARTQVAARLQNLAVFSSVDNSGASPGGPLVQGKDGNFYEVAPECDRPALLLRLCHGANHHEVTGHGRLVGEPPRRGFVGALQAHRVREGVFLTPGEFTQTARQYAEREGFKIS